MATVGTTTRTAVALPREAIEAFCHRWQITELALFGSVLGDDFGPESDVDFLVDFAPDTRWTLFDLAAMEQELAVILDRNVDVVTRRAVEGSENRLRRRAILETAQPYYVAG